MPDGGIRTRIANRLRETFPALTHANYRYFWFGQCISLIGTWMQNAGQAWLVLSTTNSPFKLSLVTAMQFLPVMFLSLFAGVFVDRFPKRTLVIVTQCIFSTLAFILSFLVLTGRIQYWHVLLMATLNGLTRTIDNPARQSMMMELVGKDTLVNAIGLNSTIFNVARIVGPAVAGITYAKVGPGWCFFLNGVSFIPVIAGLCRIRLQPRKRVVTQKNVLKEVSDGLKYITGKPVLLSTVTLAAVVNIFAVNHNVLVPVLARNVFGLGADGYGFLMSAMGTGSLVGALLTAVVGGKRGPRSHLLSISSLTIAGLLAALGFAGLVHMIPLAVAVMVLTGLFNITFSNNANTTVQLSADDEYRGRAMSVYFLMWGGTTPIGSLIAGSLANGFGGAMAYIIAGGITAVGAGGTLLLQRWAKRRSHRETNEQLPA